ncbi:hypothetical protein L596_027018 [Steinernema carpocapsae]|uniref:Uncharacterized protein n=1 Tax=Steinernema carpocapsae TaxID=34508 RepID=A0A4U5M387_STECR|nr:hypothetical protein L596_027018 [Steinernema carpocapsae]
MGQIPRFSAFLRWSTPAPTSGPDALKHGGHRRQDPKEGQRQDGATNSPRSSERRTGREAHDSMLSRTGVIWGVTTCNMLISQYTFMNS